MIGIIPPVGGQVKGYRHSCLSGRQVAPVKGIGFLRSAVAGILTDSPGPHGIHGGIRTTQIGRDTGGIFQMLQVLQILPCINRLYRNLFRCLPVCLLSARMIFFLRLGKIRLYIVEIWSHNFLIFILMIYSIPSSFWKWLRVSTRLDFIWMKCFRPFSWSISMLSLG